MDRIRELLEQETLTAEELTELAQLLGAEELKAFSAEDLEALKGAILGRFDALRDATAENATAPQLAELDALATMFEATRGEDARRTAEAAENATRREEVVARMDQARADAEDPGTPPEEPETPPAEEDDPPAPPAQGEPTEPPAEPAAPTAEAPLPVAAAAGTPRGTVGGMIPAMARAAGRATGSPELAPARRGVVIVAAAGLPHVTPGDPFEDRMDLASAMSEKLMRIQTSKDHSAHLVASVRWDYPEERQLGDDARVNTERIDAVCSQYAPRYARDTGALVATGGICAPTNVDYSVPTWSTADRPLRDALPAFQATRGGIRFVQPPDIGVPDLQGGTASGAGQSVTVWTEATDADPGDATKPVWTVACGEEEQVFVNAIPTRVKFGNMQSRFAPEQVAANTQQAIAISAREAELELLSLIAANTTQVKPGQYLGAVRDLLPTIDLTKAQYVYSHRLAKNTALSAIFPEWGRDLFRADLARELAHDNAGSINVLAITDAQIDEWFTVRGINPIWTLDGLQAGTYGTGGTAITDQFFPVLSAGQPQWPGQVTDDPFMFVWFLFVEGTFQYLDGGRLDLGVVRDSILDATNDYETFVEVFESVAFRGIDAYQVQQLVLPNGGSAGSVSTSGYTE